MIVIDKDTLWAGTQASLESALLVQRKIQDKMLAGELTIEAAAGKDAPPPKHYDTVDGVAVIPVRGALINADLPDAFAKFFGITTYPGLQRAFAAAATDKSVKSVLLDVNSPGGSVAGIQDTVDSLQALRASKPVSTFAGDLMASAGYWLGSSTDHITSTKMSTVGSIGVIGTHIEVSKMLEKEGITPTVLRAGEHKALASQYEPLSDKARAQMQDRLDAIYTQFVDHVANARGVSYPVAHSKMANGKEFFGEAALSAGLVDHIGKFPDALAFAKQKVDNGNIRRNNALSAQTEELEMSGTTNTPAPQADANTEPADAKVTPPTAEQEPAAPAASSAPSVDSGNPLVAYLQDKVTAQEAQLRDAAIAANAAQAQIAAIPALRSIAEASLNQMRIALGHPATDTAAMSADALAAEHQRTATEFGAKFPVGGVAASSLNDATAKQAPATAAPQVDPTHLARVQATRIN